MPPFLYQANELFQWLAAGEDLLVLDVRNDKDFDRFKVESPVPFELVNVSYYDFMEDEAGSVAKVPAGKRLRIVCAQEGSAKYVAEILARHGFEDVGYLAGGIKSWGNLLVPRLIHDSDDYQLYQFIRPGKASCSYGLLCAGELMLFDPSRNIDFYMDFAREQGARLIKTFETHLQADYIAGSRLLSERTGAEFWANDRGFSGAKTGHRALEDGAEHGFSTSGPMVRVVFTPGHTPGSTSYIIDERYVISGDTLFVESIGRPDLGGKAVEWTSELFATINAVKTWNPDLLILPGHYINWDEADDQLRIAMTLGGIMASNQAIYDLATEEQFLAFIQANLRPQPPEYATIRLVNANLEQPDDEAQETLDLGKNECAASAYAAAQADREQTGG